MATQMPKLFMSAPHLNSLATGLGAEEAATAVDATIWAVCLRVTLRLCRDFDNRHCACELLIGDGVACACFWKDGGSEAELVKTGAALQTGCIAVIDDIFCNFATGRSRQIQIGTGIYRSG